MKSNILSNYENKIKGNKLYISDIIEKEKNQREYHLPGYNYCGPGTKVVTRLVRGDKGINDLDEACRRHDVDYYMYAGDNEKIRESDLKLRRIAKKIGGFYGKLIDKVFSSKRFLESVGLLDPSKFASSLSKFSLDNKLKKKLGKYLLKKYF